MKLILIVPPFPVQERYTTGLAKVANVLPPLGLAYIAASLEEEDIEVEIIDAMALNLSFESLIERIHKAAPDIIGLSALTATFNRCLKIATGVKKLLPKTLIVLGGTHASLFPEDILKQSRAVDIVVIGEGEETMLELIQAVENDKNLKDVKGIAFRNENKVIINQPRPPLQDLDKLPFPAWHLLPLDKYRPAPQAYKRLPLATMVTSRGCPFQCSFCSHAVFGKIHRKRSPENVIQEIKYSYKKYSIREIAIFDDVFTLDKSWIVRFCNFLIAEKLDLIWSCESRVDLVDLVILKKMRQAGCWNIFYGLESGNQEILNKISKGITLEQIRKAVKWTHEVGMEIRASFMLALPGETPKEAIETINFAKELNCKYTKFNITSPFPGTKLYSQAKTSGRLKENLDEYTTQHPIFVPSGYKDEQQILDMKKRAFREFYLRPKYIAKRIREINSIKDLISNIKTVSMIWRG